MIDYTSYGIRTLKHINLVQRRGLQLVNKMGLDEQDKYEFIKNLSRHDASKFTGLQEVYYPAKFNNDNVTEEDEDTFERAWKEHYTIENHHPIGMDGVCNSKIIAMEIACDLQAMSDEFHEDDVRKFYTEKWLPENIKEIVDVGDWTRMNCVMEECFIIFKEADNKTIRVEI